MKQKTRVVYLVRHGQSVDNASPVFQSEDTPLSERGLEQAKALGKRFKNVDFDALIASPLPRTRQTAEAIANTTGKTIEFNPLFVERRKPKSVDGKPWSDTAAANTYIEWHESIYTSGKKIEDGENYDELVARADKALHFLTDKTEQSIVLVTHGLFLRVIVARVLLGDALSDNGLRHFMQSTDIENTGITVLKFKGIYEEPEPRWRLWSLNDHAHFAD